jgi:hypothetical protein
MDIEAINLHVINQFRSGGEVGGGEQSWPAAAS